MNSKQLLKKRKIIFTSFIIIASAIIVAVIFLAVFIKNDTLKTILNLSLLFVLLVIALIYRRPLYTYNNLAKIANLILNQSPPITYSKNVVDNPGILLGNNFIKFADTNKFTIFYKHSQLDSVRGLSRRVFKIEIVTIIKESKIDFYDQTIDIEIKKIEAIFPKRERPTKYIITEYKNYDKIDDKAKKELSEVVCYSLNRASYVQINVGFLKQENKAYFLYSDLYNPSSYYKQGVEFIKKIIGKQKDIYIEPFKK